MHSELPVLVDFWAVWCAPCKVIDPTIEYLAQNYVDRLKIVKLNVDENMKIPSRYGVRSIPTLLLFMEGELKETIIGAASQDKIINTISKYL